MQLIPNPVEGDFIDQSESMYPTRMVCRTIGGQYHASMSSTTYAICLEGILTLSADRKWDPDIHMIAGTVACFHGSKAILPSVPFKMILIERLGYRGLQMTAQCENKGRLAYIDGCSDTAILPPARSGDSCLNTLHFPPNIIQTQHLHPDIRMGVVLNGRGVAWQDTSLTGKGWKKDLVKGGMFCLEESEIHSFKTEKDRMDIAAFHPTSNTGPSDDDHPMLNRTLIGHGK